MTTTAIYPGTFDPATCGHRDVCERGLKMFDQIVVAVADNPVKNPFFSLQERIDMLNIVFAEESRIIVKPFSGLLIKFVRECESQIVIRGLRAISDFEYEVQLAGMNQSLAPEIETVFLTAAEKYKFVSSSLVREIARLGGDISEFIHPEIHKRLVTKLKNQTL